MLSFISFLLLVFAFNNYPIFHNSYGGKIIALTNAADIRYAEPTADALKKSEETSAAAASELDILMPPIELTESFAGIADITIAPNSLSTQRGIREGHGQPPNWWHTYDALLMALGMMMMLLLMVLATHCMWRRHIDHRAAEWEAESTRIFNSTPYYADGSQILVY